MDVCTLPLRTGSMMESLGEDNVSLVLLEESWALPAGVVDNVKRKGSVWPALWPLPAFARPLSTAIAPSWVCLCRGCLLAWAQETSVPHQPLPSCFLIPQKPGCWVCWAWIFKPCVLHHLPGNLRTSYVPCWVVTLSQGRKEHGWKKLHVWIVLTDTHASLSHDW